MAEEQKRPLVTVDKNGGKKINWDLYDEIMQRMKLKYEAEQAEQEL